MVIDPVGGAYSEAALRATRWGGRFVVVGFASGEIPRIPLNLVLLKGVVIKGFEFRTFAEHAPEAARRDRDELSELFATGRIRPLRVGGVPPGPDRGGAAGDGGPPGAREDRRRPDSLMTGATPPPPEWSASPGAGVGRRAVAAVVAAVIAAPPVSATTARAQFPAVPVTSCQTTFGGDQASAPRIPDQLPLAAASKTAARLRVLLRRLRHPARTTGMVVSRRRGGRRRPQPERLPSR